MENNLNIQISLRGTNFIILYTKLADATLKDGIVIW